MFPEIPKVCFVIVVVIGMSLTSSGASIEGTYRVAVYEHKPVIVRTAASPLDRMMANVDQYELVIIFAAQQNVNLIVFPEYGTYATAFYNSRDALFRYLQHVPESFTPFVSQIPSSEVILRLSCLAMTHNITVVANLGTYLNCSSETDPNCPSDGRYLFNTNLAFENGTGRILAKYYKHNLFGERFFDQGPLQYVTFPSPVGPIGLGVCFDLLFKEPLVSMVETTDLKLVVLPSLWFNRIPFLAMYEIAEAWAVRMGVHLLVANIHNPRGALTGSGIFGPQGHVSYIYEPAHNTNGKLAVVDIPLHRSRLAQSMEHNVEECGVVNAERPLQSTADEFTAKTNGDVFNYKRLNIGSAQETTVCMDGLCCRANYDLSEAAYNGFFALGVFSGLHQENYTLYNEVCAIVRCTDDGRCGDGISVAAGGFKKLELQALTTRDTYWFPTVLGDDARLMKNGEWKFKRPSNLQKTGLQSVLAFGLYGRLY